MFQGVPGARLNGVKSRHIIAFLDLIVWLGGRQPLHLLCIYYIYSNNIYYILLQTEKTLERKM